MTERIRAGDMLLPCGVVALLLGWAAETIGSGQTRPATQPDAGEMLTRVREILAPVKPADPEAVRKAEDALAGLGKSHLAVLRRVFPEQADPVRREIVDAAIVRIDWGVDSREAVRRWIDENVKKIAARRLPRPRRLTEDALLKTFPGFRFFSLLVRQWPNPRKIPGPLKRNNLFLVSRDGSVQHLADLKRLGQVFRPNAPVADSREGKRRLAEAWITLSQEMHNDGLYVFSVRIGGVVTNKSDGTSRVVAKATVQPRGGDRGHILATLSFNAKGNLIGIREKAELTPRGRPAAR